MNKIEYKEIMKKDIIQKIWDEEIPTNEIVDFINKEEICHIDICGDMSFGGYFSFVRCFNNKGTYQFTLPYLFKDGETWDSIQCFDYINQL